jgi:hypothetical protein
MRNFGKGIAALLWALLILAPSAVFAQASITGTVKDTSGGVLPGVTVEAASPALIEKVRTVVTDSNGRYQIVDLRPGAYTVTFTLPGFNTFKRDGVTLQGANAVAVDAELKVGALEETVTVTGEAPVVDTQTITKSASLTSQTVDSLPTARNYFTLARMVPGTSGGGNDVGGSQIQDVGTGVTVHGSRSTDQRVTVNGVSTMTLQAGGSIGGQTPDVGSAAEVTVDTTNLSADLDTGGVRINFIPRDGGNNFSNATFFTISDDSLQGDNFTDELKAAGLGTPNSVIRNWDINESIGGPIKKDKVWFWFSTRYNRVENQAAVFANQNAYNPNAWTYAADTTQPGVLKGNQLNNSIRVTWQATPRNKFAGTYKADKWCNCPSQMSATLAPEAARDRRFPRLRQEHAEWSSPVTNKLLLEAVGLHLFERWGNMNLRTTEGGGSLEDPAQFAVLPQMIPVSDQRTGLEYRQQVANYNNTLVPNFTYRAAASYVTGTHAVKVGFSNLHGFLTNHQFRLNDLSYRVNSVDANNDNVWESVTPNQFTMYATPFDVKSEMRSNFGVYAQDRVNLGRMTVQGAIRLDTMNTGFPEQSVGSTVFTPNRDVTFPEQDSVAWRDVTYRSGFIYDVRGNGKTAVKLSFNKYLLGQTLNGNTIAENPLNTLVSSTTRNWTDNDHDMVIDCDLLNPAAQNPATGAVDTCGAFGSSTFGQVTPAARFDKDLLTGWGHRPANWELSASVQHELMRGVGVDFGYFRRIWKNFAVTDNELVGPNDFTKFSLTVPTDSRLSTSGQTLTGLYTINPDKFGQSNLLNTLSDKYGKQTDHWNGFDLTVNARLQNGLLLNGGVSAGKQVTDNCEIVAALPEMNFASGNVNGTLTPADFCHSETPFQPQYKGYFIYTVPKVAVQLSGTYRNTPGASQTANYTASQTVLNTTSTLGRTLAGNASSMTVVIVDPNQQYLDRRNELDLRIGKILRFGKVRSQVSLDIFNALNSDAVLTASTSYATWLRPNSILNARLMKISVNLDF